MKRATPASALKLVVRREIVRQLEQQELVAVVGGDSNATCPTTGVVGNQPKN